MGGVVRGRMRRRGGGRGGEWEEEVVGEGENVHGRRWKITQINWFLFSKIGYEYKTLSLCNGLVIYS